MTANVTIYITNVGVSSPNSYQRAVSDTGCTSVGTLMLKMSKVITIAKTPSLKASMRDLSIYIQTIAKVSSTSKCTTR